MTHLLQCIDTHVGKSFKNELYEEWANWMLEGTQIITASGNRQKAPFLEVLKWCKNAWEKVSEDTIKKGAEYTHMTSDLGEELEWEWSDVAEEIPKKKKNETDEEKVFAVKSMDPVSQKEAAEIKKEKRLVNKLRKQAEEEIAQLKKKKMKEVRKKLKEKKGKKKKAQSRKKKVARRTQKKRKPSASKKKRKS